METIFRVNKLIFLFFFILSFLGHSQETFLVLHVQGKVIHDTITKPLVPGDEFKGNPKFKFSSGNDKVALLSNLRGRIILFPKTKSNENISQISFYLKNNVLPVKEYTATRSNDDNYTILFFDKNKLFLPKKIKAFTIPSNELSYYAIEYTSKGKTFLTKLEVDNNGFLELNSNTFLLNENKINSHDIERIFLKFYDYKSKKIFEIKSLLFKHFSINQIQAELVLYNSELKKLNVKTPEIKLKLQEYLKEFYSSDLKLSDFEIK